MAIMQARNFNMLAGQTRGRRSRAAILPLGKTSLPLAAAAFMLLACLASASVPAAELELPVLWTADVETLLESAASVADLDRDGRDEVVVAGREEIVALGAGGRTLWRWHAKGRFMTYPSVLERRDLPPLIYAADTSGVLTCLDGTGKQVWQARLKGPASWSAAVVADLDADGAPEVVQTDDKGTVWAFSALDGKAIWQASVTGAPVSPAVGDLDGDGKAEVVVATGAGMVAAIRADGSLCWSRQIGGTSPSWSTAAPVVFAAADGRGRVAVASSERELVCLDGEGKTLWQRPIRGPAASSISVGDIDLDGRADLLVVTQLGEIYRFDEQGRIVWQIDMQGRSLAAGAIIDINGDGRLEYTLCTQRGRLLVLDDQGRFLFDRQFDTRMLNVTPTFGDIEPQSAGLEMVLTGGESGKVFCLATQAAAAGPAQWTAYRGDGRKSGSWFGLRQRAAAGMTPRNLAWDELLAGDDIRFDVDNPQGGPAPLTATAVCVRPDGQRQVATSRILGSHGQLRMPIDLVVPGIYRFTWSLKDANQRELAAGARQVVVRPFVNDRALARRAASNLKATAAAAESVLPRSAAALRHEAMFVEAQLNALAPRQDSAPGSAAAAQREIVDKTAALVARARRALALARIVRHAVELGPDTSLVAFAGSMWENRGVDRQLPERVENPLKISRRAVPGEHEPIAVALLNVTDQELQVRVHVEVADSGPTVVAHRSVCVPTSVGGRSWDPLPELDEASLLSIPSLASRELWLDVDTGAAAPGEHQITVRLQAIDGAGVLDGPKTPRSVPAPETSVAIQLRLLPFQMAPPGAIRLCTWAAPEGSQVEDLLAHGNNVFATGHGTPQFDEQGHLTGCDYTGLDRVITRFRGHDVVLLLQGIPGLRGKFGTAPYRAELAAYLNNLVAHMASVDVDTEHFALYPLDEPGGQGWDAVNKLVAFGKMVRAVNPDIMIYMDGGGELPMYQAMAPYIDVWCPAITMLPEQSAVMEVARTTGKMLWSYDCVYAYARPVGPNIKNVNVIGQFRTAALLALRHGATGIGYWCYNIGGDPWTRIKDEYPLVYPGRTRPVTSRRWEAVREGIEDYRILAALRDRLRAGESAPLDPAVQARIRHVLEDGLAALVDQSFAEVNLGLGRTAIDATNSARSLDAFRSELLDCVEAVAAAADRPGPARHGNKGGAAALRNGSRANGC